LTGKEYFRDIKEELLKGRHRHRKGVNILGAFGYVRRRQTAIDEINEALQFLGLETYPPINAEMPLTAPRIRFYLATNGTSSEERAVSIPQVAPTMEDDDFQDDNIGGDGVQPAVVSSFKVAELAAAQNGAECIGASETIQKAYTIMSLKKYSQLVVADSARPLATAIK